MNRIQKKIVGLLYKQAMDKVALSPVEQTATTEGDKNPIVSTLTEPKTMIPSAILAALTYGGHRWRQNRFKSWMNTYNTPEKLDTALDAGKIAWPAARHVSNKQARPIDITQQQFDTGVKNRLAANPTVNSPVVTPAVSSLVDKAKAGIGLVDTPLLQAPIAPTTAITGARDNLIRDRVANQKAQEAFTREMNPRSELEVPASREIRYKTKESIYPTEIGATPVVPTPPPAVPAGGAPVKAYVPDIVDQLCEQKPNQAAAGGRRSLLQQIDNDRAAATTTANTQPAASATLGRGTPRTTKKQRTMAAQDKGPTRANAQEVQDIFKSFGANYKSNIGKSVVRKGH